MILEELKKVLRDSTVENVPPPLRAAVAANAECTDNIYPAFHMSTFMCGQKKRATEVAL